MKHTLLLVMVSAVALTMDAQIGLYLGLGYGCGPKERLGSDYLQTENMEMESPLFGSLGTAVNVNLGVTYDLCDHGGVGLEVDYVRGLRQTIQMDRIETSFYNSTFVSEDRNTSIQAIPFAYIQVPFGETWGGYGRVGPVINLVGQNFWHEEATTESVVFNTTYVWEETTKQSLALGWRASVGLTYKLTDNISLTLEALTQALSAKSKSTEVTMYMLDGADALGDLTVYDKMIMYVPKLDQTSNNSTFNDDYNENQAEERLPETHNLSNTQCRFGVRLTF